MNPIYSLLLILIFFLGCSQQEIQHEKPLVEAKISSDFTSVQNRLREMALADAKVRVEFDAVFSERSKSAEGSAAFKAVYMRMREQDIANHEELASMVHAHGWIDSGRFGKQASSDAWLITQHMVHDKGIFQKKMASLMDPSKNVDPTHYALLKDRIAVIFDKSPQEYGTQGKCQKDGDWTASPIRDFEKVDERRLAIGFETFAEYEFKMDAKCLKRFKK